jgi:hypothetical protein
MWRPERKRVALTIQGYIKLERRAGRVISRAAVSDAEQVILPRIVLS